MYGHGSHAYAARCSVSTAPLVLWSEVVHAQQRLLPWGCGMVGVVTRLADVDAEVLAARSKVLRGEHEALGPPWLGGPLPVLLPLLAVLQRVVAQVGDEFVRREGDEPRDALTAMGWGGVSVVGRQRGGGSAHSVHLKPESARKWFVTSSGICEHVAP